MTDVQKWAFVGDLQLPYHDPRAVGLFFKAMKWWKPDIIDIVGDIDDQLEYSTFADGTTDEFFNILKNNAKENEKAALAFEKASIAWNLKLEKNPVEAMDEMPKLPVLLETDPMPMVKANANEAKKFYTELRGDHKDADMHASLGNHDIRIFKYIDKKAPDYIEQVTVNELWGLDDLGITWKHYEAPPLQRYAGIHVHHGATVTSTGLAVRSDIESYNVSLVRGHDHRGGVVYKSYPMTGGSLVGMGTGHLCDPAQMTYTVNPSWEKGFGIAHLVDGKAHLQFIPIRSTDKGLMCVLDGKVLTN